MRPKCDNCKQPIKNRRNKKYCSHECYSRSIGPRIEGIDRNCKKCKTRINITLAKKDGFCVPCNRERRKIDNEKKFFDKAFEIHGNQYDYSLVEYKGVDEKVTIICPNHGNFTMTPSNHIHSKQRCKKCRSYETSNRIRSNTTEFIAKAKLIHGNQYNYDKVEYISSSNKVIIICPTHGEFLQTPNSHLSKSGCKQCSIGVSIPCVEWLNSLHLNLEREYNIPNTNYRADGFDPLTNTVYEYLGNYWHGNPEKHDCNNINKINKKSFGELFEETINRLAHIKSLGYNLVYIWGD